MIFLAEAARQASDTGPTWLAVVGAIGLGSVISALITAGSLIYQNKRNAERDAQRRAEDATERRREREHAAKEAEKEREHARQMLVDTHNTTLGRERAADIRKQEADLAREKLDAYSHFLSLVNRAERIVDNKTNFAWRSPGQSLLKLQVLTLEELQELQMAATKVMFFSPSATDIPKYKGKLETSAESMMEALQTVAVAYEFGLKDGATTDYIRDMFTIMNQARAQYIEGVREEFAHLFGRDPQALPPKS